ncbi:MAG: hypothetical protein ACYS7Y_36605 [Planctomycetota bacterium]|jgi:hypothetical protein
MRYTLIRYSEKYGLVCVWDHAQGVAITLGAVNWNYMKDETL